MTLLPFDHINYRSLIVTSRRDYITTTTIIVIQLLRTRRCALNVNNVRTQSVLQYRCPIPIFVDGNRWKKCLSCARLRLPTHRRVEFPLNVRVPSLDNATDPNRFRWVYKYATLSVFHLTFIIRNYDDNKTRTCLLFFSLVASSLAILFFEQACRTPYYSSATRYLIISVYPSRC